MAIFINNYTWQQSNKKVTIDVPFTTTSKDKMSIICTSNYLKVSKPPYIFEAVLAQPVEHDATVVKLTDEGINIELVKLTEKRWSDLRQNLTKEELAVEREKALEFVARLEAEAAEKRGEERLNRERLSVKEQMRVDEAGRKSREAAQQQEKNRALAEVFRVTSPPRRRRRPSEVTVFSVSELTESEESCGQDTELGPAEEQTLREQEPVTVSSSACSTPSKGAAAVSAVHAARSATPAAAAPVRTAGTIRCAFTPRQFPSAARESRSEEEQEWLRKQADKYRRDGALDEADLRPHEKDPRWLKERGDAFYQHGNYLAAINAYSHAIHAASNAPELYSNRAACHLRLNNFHKTLEDSSSALDLLTPAVEANRVSRLRCHVRRGTALLRLGACSEALAEYEMALSLDPNNEKLMQDVKTVRRLAEGYDSDPDELSALD
ncbi:dynein axonemal assembly factor 4-like [Amphibalanus amphitrite]|nr:dynein axonemal assembly factor 4-like [Amphibalanus amphitrite]